MINSVKSLIALKRPKVMGVLNITTNSFYDGGNYINNNKYLLKHIEYMLIQGADIIDIGGCSTNPGSKMIKIKDELNRVIPTIKMIIKKFPNVILSIDTYRSKVADIAVKCGVKIINDISGGSLDKNMFKIVSKLKVPYILTHMQGNPYNMQNSPYYNNIILNIKNFFVKKIKELKILGINDIILDPGFGFGKTIEHNIKILKNISLIIPKTYPVMIGVSRKTTIQKILKKSANDCLNGTSVFHTIALLNGVSILRVHDVKECIECIKIIKYYNDF